MRTCCLVPHFPFNPQVKINSSQAYFSTLQKLAEPGPTSSPLALFIHEVLYDYQLPEGSQDFSKKIFFSLSRYFQTHRKKLKKSSDLLALTHYISRPLEGRLAFGDLLPEAQHPKKTLSYALSAKSGEPKILSQWIKKVGPDYKHLQDMLTVWAVKFQHSTTLKDLQSSRNKRIGQYFRQTLDADLLLLDQIPARPLLGQKKILAECLLESSRL